MTAAHQAKVRDLNPQSGDLPMTADPAPAPLRVTCFLFDRKVGGPHICASGIYGRFIARGHDARIAIPAGEGNAKDYFEARRLPVDQLRISPPVSPRRIGAFLKYLLGLPLSVLRTRSYLKRHRAGVIRVNGALDLVPVFAGWLARVPVIVYLNDTVFPPRFSRILIRVVRPFATRIIAAATPVGAHYGLDMDKEQVIFEPVDTARFRPRMEAGYPSRSPTLGLIANWNPIKCQERFLDVIERLRADGLDIRGRILGSLFQSQEGYWRPLLDRIETTGLAGAIEAPGFVDDTVLELAQFDLLLLTSRSEACPVCVLEAMATGVPVVSFDVGGVTEMLGTGTDDPAGIAIPEGDTVAMADAVRTLLNDRDRYRAMALSGPRRVEAHFSLEICVHQHEALCAELAGQKRSVAK